MLKIITISLLVTLVLPIYTHISYIIRYWDIDDRIIVPTNNEYQITQIFDSFETNINDETFTNENFEESIVFKSFNK